MTAAEQLQRILYIVPRAAREKDGVPIAELARDAGVSEKQILVDLETVLAREYYYPAASTFDIGITIDAERVTVRSKHFDRPTRFTPKEALALALGMRVLAAENAEMREGLLAHAEELEAALAGASVEDIADSYAIAQGDGADALRGLLEDAATQHRAVALQYVKAGAAAPPAERIVHPYALACGGLHWYLVAFCTQSNEPRVFRLDRIFAARMLEEPFEVLTDFDIAIYVEQGWVYRADAETEAQVRYSADIARWMLEKGPAEGTPDGGVIVGLSVADPHWLVRHVLEHAPDAEVVEPASLRKLVAQVSGTIAVTGGQSAAQ